MISQGTRSGGKCAWVARASDIGSPCAMIRLPWAFQRMTGSGITVRELDRLGVPRSDHTNVRIGISIFTLNHPGSIIVL